MSNTDTTTVSSNTSSSEEKVSKHKWTDKNGYYKPFYFAMILTMTWGGFALLSGIYFIWQSRRSQNKNSYIEGKEIPVVQGQPVEQGATSATAQARGGGGGQIRRLFGRPFRRQQQFPAMQTSINQV